jgi:hypothetical protein
LHTIAGVAAEANHSLVQFFVGYYHSFTLDNVAFILVFKRKINPANVWNLSELSKDFVALSKTAAKLIS